MKISTGRGIQFFKKPIFSAPKNFVLKTYKYSKNQISSLVQRRKKK